MPRFRPRDADGDAIGRRSMVRGQLEARHIHDRAVLNAMAEVPREEFVPSSQRRHALEDRALGIGHGQTISQPFMVARMSELLGLASDHLPPSNGHPKVLDIGTGSGYQAAVLAAMGAEVISIERDADLAQAATARLQRLGYDVSVRVGDGSVGLPLEAPFAGIVVAAGAPGVPSGLPAQLADGARLVVPVGTRATQRLTIVQRRGRRFTTEAADPCVFVPLVGQDGHPG